MRLVSPYHAGDGGLCPASHVAPAPAEKKPVAEPGWVRPVVLSLAEMRQWLCLTPIAQRRRRLEDALH